MKILIIGGGEVGTRLADLFVEEKHEVAVIEKNEDVATELSNSIEALVINGDGTDRKTLVDAGIEDVDYLVTTTDDDKVNLLSCQIAKKYGAKKTVSRVSDPENYELFLDMDIQPVNQVLSTVTSMYNTLFSTDRQNLVAYIADEKLEISKLIVASNSEVIGKKIDDINIKKNIFIIQRDDKIIYPNKDTQIMEADTIYAVAPKEDSAKIIKKIRGEK